jgi:putative CocE/NonD family hydrolase
VERNDVIAFQTCPLPEDVTVVGNITVRLWVSSDAPDTDFYVRLLDVYPCSKNHRSGFAFPVTDGILRARYRSSFETHSLMKPGEKYLLNIPLEPTANVFQAGHRIQVYICSSNFPDFAVNRNNADLNDGTPRVATNCVFHELGHESHILLPVLSSPGEGGDNP